MEKGHSVEKPILFTKNKEGTVAIVSLNRPQKRNAFDDKTLSEFIHCLEELAKDECVRVLVIKGEGEHFCAGADITWMQKKAQAPFKENLEDALSLAQLMQLLYEIKKPTLCVVQGNVYGGGLGLVAASDIVLSHPNTQFCFSEVKLGLIPAVVGPYVIQAIGQRAAMRYMLTAETFDAHTAKMLGLIHEIADGNEMEALLNYFIEKLIKNGPIALQRCKEMLHFLSQNPKGPAEYQLYTSELIARLRASPEAQEGMASFLNGVKS